MPRDTKTFEQRHAHDTYPNSEHVLLMNSEFVDEYQGLTEVCKAIARLELELYPWTEFVEEIEKLGGLRQYIRAIIDMHVAFGTDA